MIIFLGFLMLGLTTGFLTGMSSSPLAISMIALLFAFAGGSAVTLLTKLSRPQTELVGALLLALSVGTLIGCCAGVVVNENRLLTFRSLMARGTQTEHQESYLKAASPKEIQIILNQWRDGILKESDAKARIKEIVSQ
jgi:thiol:disulfide interchange protein